MKIRARGERLIQAMNPENFREKREHARENIDEEAKA